MCQIQSANYLIFTALLTVTHISSHMCQRVPCDGSLDCNSINNTRTRCIFRECRIPSIDGLCQQSADCIRDQVCIHEKCRSIVEDGPCQVNAHCLRYQQCDQQDGLCYDKENMSFPVSIFYFLLSIFFLIISIFVCMNIPSDDDPII